jgi:hypothetical protein
MDGLPVFIRNRIESKIHRLTTDVAEYCLLLHASPPVQSRMGPKRRVAVLLDTTRDSQNEMSRRTIEARILPKVSRAQPID